MLVLQLTRHDPLASTPSMSTYGLQVHDDEQDDSFFVSFEAPTDLLDEAHVPVNLGRIGAWLCEAVLDARSDGNEDPAICLSNALEYGEEVRLHFDPEPRLDLPRHEAHWEHMGLMEEHADFKAMFETENALEKALPAASSSPRPKL